MLENIKAVIFDLDGTLVDSNGLWQEIDNVFMGSKNIDIPEDLPNLIDGMSYSQVADFFHDYFKLEETPEELMNIWSDMAYLEYKTKIKTKPGAKDFIKYLYKNNIKMAIASSNSRKMIEAALINNEIIEYIDCIITSDELKTGKDSPKIYLETAKQLNVEPKNCLVFEDIVPGLEACNTLGMKTCAIYDEHYYSDEYEENKKFVSDYYIKDFTEIEY